MDIFFLFFLGEGQACKMSQKTDCKEISVKFVSKTLCFIAISIYIAVAKSNP